MASAEGTEDKQRVPNSAAVERGWRQFKERYDKNKFVIENRWIGMNKEQRVNLLTKAWKESDPGKSEMPKGHRPDLLEVAPWRDPTDKYRKFLPLKTPLDKNPIRWPSFNQDDLTKRFETFLTLLASRAEEHPREFALLDCFPGTQGIAINEGLVPKFRNYVWQPGLALVTIQGASESGGEYGTKYFPIAEWEAFGLLATTQIWPELSATSVMENQRRIYNFLSRMVIAITTFDVAALKKPYNVAGEGNDPEWSPQVPDRADLGTSEYEADLENYVDCLRDIMPYTSITEDLLQFTFGICYQRMTFYANQIQGIKSSPHVFYKYISDMREHSHHEVQYARGESHAWSDYNRNLHNSEMFGTYLMKALYTLTEKYDGWCCALKACVHLEEQEPDTRSYYGHVIYLCNILWDFVRMNDLTVTLACSRSLRQYFRNSDFDENNPNLDTVAIRRLPKVDKNRKIAALITILRAWKEDKVKTFLSDQYDTWVDEILTTFRDDKGDLWMTNFAHQQAEESYDAITAFGAMMRIYDREFLTPHYKFSDYKGYEEYKKFSDRLREIDPKSEAITKIVSKHMTPNPNLRFAYPEIADDQRGTKRREHAATRQASEENLAALWAELQPFLIEQQALSEAVTNELDKAIPLATEENGDEMILDEPPPPPEPPQTPPPGEASEPSTPTAGPSGTGNPTTPSGALQGLAINSPSKRSPTERTPEKKTSNDGVKKTIPPNRRQRKDEGQPRRPMTERRKARQEQLEQILAGGAGGIAAAAPIAGPEAGTAFPKIELDSANYNLLKDIMTTDQRRRQGRIKWEDICKLLQAIGFESDPRGRRAGGSVEIFRPSNALRESQGIQNKPISRDRPHDGYLDIRITRDLFRGPHGLGKYDWDFDHFKEAGT